MGTGWYRDPFLDRQYFETHSTDEIAADIVRDIEVGVADTGVRAGVIGEIACDRVITPAEERSFRAAARAHLRTGATISTHAARWPIGHAQLDILCQEGVDPGRVIIGHSEFGARSGVPRVARGARRVGRVRQDRRRLGL